MTDDDVALPDEDAAPPADAASPVDSAPASDAVAWSAPVVKSDAVVIHAKGLTKRYGSRTAVDHLTSTSAGARSSGSWARTAPARPRPS